jgi:hypothetical protein
MTIDEKCHFKIDLFSKWSLQDCCSLTKIFKVIGIVFRESLIYAEIQINTV